MTEKREGGWWLHLKKRYITGGNELVRDHLLNKSQRVCANGFSKDDTIESSGSIAVKCRRFIVSMDSCGSAQ